MKTPVVFRKFPDGQIIALFPGEPGADRDPRYSCSSYMHIGQHGAADYQAVIRSTRPATADEYGPLRRELESTPYDYRLDIRSRWRF